MRILCKIAGVIGSLSLVVGGVCREYARFILDCIKRRRGSDESSLGSGRPSVICMCLIAERCIFIVCGAKC